MEIFTIETARPINDVELLKAFYQQELKYIRRFLDTNKFQYAYYQFDMKSLTIYFSCVVASQLISRCRM